MYIINDYPQIVAHFDALKQRKHWCFLGAGDEGHGVIGEFSLVLAGAGVSPEGVCAGQFGFVIERTGLSRRVSFLSVPKKSLDLALLLLLLAATGRVAVPDDSQDLIMMSPVEDVELCPVVGFLASLDNGSLHLNPDPEQN